jgi:hypothetical protein
MNNIIDSILKYNAGREPERLAMKYQAMRQEAFSFMRGTCHLYYQDWPATDKQLNDAPLAWICGDLHLENFGLLIISLVSPLRKSEWRRLITWVFFSAQRLCFLGNFQRVPTPNWI